MKNKNILKAGRQQNRNKKGENGSDINFFVYQWSITTSVKNSGEN